MLNRNNKVYSYEEVANILRGYDEQASEKRIAESAHRTESAIRSLTWHFEAYKKDKAPKGMSSLWKKYFKRYLSTNGRVAESLREEVQSNSKAVQQTDTDTAKTEKLLQAVEANWKLTLNSIADLVEHEAKRRTAQETAKLEKELTELREFKTKAQDSNIAGTLRKSLMAFK